MSTTKFLRAGLIASIGVAGLTLTANAQSRYGNVYDYESGRNCGAACVAPAPLTPQANTRYGAPIVAAPTYNQAPVYVDCTQLGTCAPQPSVVYTQPAPVYTQHHSGASIAQAAPVNCPSGTTPQSDGTCLQGGMGSFSMPANQMETLTMPGTFSQTPVSCPTGTTLQSDGTCLQGGSSGFQPMEPSNNVIMPGTFNRAPADCPAGTTAQSDGTCLQGAGGVFSAPATFSENSVVEIYQGDAATQSTGSYGYSTDGTYGRTDYLPIRK